MKTFLVILTVAFGIHLAFTEYYLRDIALPSDKWLRLVEIVLFLTALGLALML